MLLGVRRPERVGTDLMDEGYRLNRGLSFEE